MRCAITDYLKVTSLLCLALLITACGFHLRGNIELQGNLKALAVKDAPQRTAIAIDLRRALLSQGVDISDAAPMVLQLHSESNNKRVLSVDTQGRAQEYGLSYTVTFSVLDAEGVAWITKETVTTHRDLQFDPNAVLGSNSEEDRLNEEMRRDAVNRILRRLQNASPPVE